MDAVKRAEAGVDMPDVCIELGISTATFYKWRAKYGDMEVDFSLPSERVIRELKQIISRQGKPEVIRCDNCPEYTSAVIQTSAQEMRIRLEYIQPGNPQQNAYVERFNRTARYNWLSQYSWSDLAQVQDFATKWM